LLRTQQIARGKEKVVTRFLLSLICGFFLLAEVTASELVFERNKHRLTLLDQSGKKVAEFEAFNNVITGKEPFPAGVFKFAHTKKHKDDAPGSAYGSHGIVVFDVPKRTGMGVHSGRADAKRNPGPKHPTLGCIRTTDDAMKRILELHSTDKITQLKVTDD
jgi:hypothetical protein